jgi:hypothetical protein
MLMPQNELKNVPQAGAVVAVYRGDDPVNRIVVGFDFASGSLFRVAAGRAVVRDSHGKVWVFSAQAPTPQADTATSGAHLDESLLSALPQAMLWRLRHKPELIGSVNPGGRVTEMTTQMRPPPRFSGDPKSLPQLTLVVDESGGVLSMSLGDVRQSFEYGQQAIDPQLAAAGIRPTQAFPENAEVRLTSARFVDSLRDPIGLAQAELSTISKGRVAAVTPARETNAAKSGVVGDSTGKVTDPRQASNSLPRAGDSGPLWPMIGAGLTLVAVVVYLKVRRRG